MTSQITIENCSKTLQELYKIYNNISKPKFQRDLLWTILPTKNEKIANFKDYIYFLMYTLNSVNTISLGSFIQDNEEKYTIIDGNNRINAVITFLNKPYLIFPEKYENLFKIINDHTYDEKDILIILIENLSYMKLSSFRRLNSLLCVKIDDVQLKKKIQDELIKIKVDLPQSQPNDATSLKKPYSIFPEKYVNLFKIISEHTYEQKDMLIKLIENLSYMKLSSFDNLDDLLCVKIDDGELHKKIEEELIKIQENFLDNNRPYDEIIKMNINILKNGSFEQYCKIFTDLNNRNGTLSPNEMLSGQLFNIHIDITNDNIKHDIIRHIKDFYDNRGTNEVLSKFNYEYTDNINAFDFIVGLQNYCNEKYPTIHKFDREGISMFFSAYKFLYGSYSSDDKYSTDNVNEFIEKILYAAKIIDIAYNTIFLNNVENSIFNKSSSKDKCIIKKNPMLILLITNIANLKKKSEKYLINFNRIVIIYHMLSNRKYLKKDYIDDEKLNIYKVDDNIEYQAGGSYIENLCKKIYEKEPEYIFNITKDKFYNLINDCIKCNINEDTYDNNNTTRKRRKLNLLDTILICNYWNTKAPATILDNKFSIDHITPFSSKWDNKIDIDRIGNLVPTFYEINSKRGNNDLSIYQKPEYQSIYQCIKYLLPKNYKEINKYDSRKTTIISNDKYNEYCSNNEKLLVDALINELFQ
jgi:hypothetical protein